MIAQQGIIKAMLQNGSKSKTKWFLLNQPDWKQSYFCTFLYMYFRKDTLAQLMF